MIYYVIQRFRYRFDLWRRERREDLFGVPRDDPRTIREYSAERTAGRWSDPKYNDILAESTWRSIVRGLGIYLRCAKAID
jgi:hypothetical protein